MSFPLRRVLGTDGLGEVGVGRQQGMTERLTDQRGSLAGLDGQVQRLVRLHGVHAQIVVAADQAQEGGFARFRTQGLEHGPNAGAQRVLGLCVRPHKLLEFSGQPVGRALSVLHDVPEFFE
ncbi:hypothetical protein D9M68_944130 [compost metagenome]